MRAIFLLSALSFVTLAGCTAPTGSDANESETSDEAVTSATELSTRAGDTTVWVRQSLARVGDAFVMHGRTSRNLTGGNGYIVDDPYGDFAQLSPRTFTLTWRVSEARGLADGVDQLIGLDFTHSKGKPDAMAAHVIVRPRLDTFTGSSKIYLTAELTPVVVGGAVVYRISGHSTGANTDVQARIAGLQLGGVKRLDGTKFQIDLAPEQAFALTAGGDLQVIVMYPTGGVDKHAHLGLAVKTLDATTADAEETWPRPTCTTAMRACLSALPAGTVDTASCGDAYHVNACTGSVGVRVDDASIQAELQAATVRLATPALRADAEGLAGTDRADAFLTGAKSAIQTKLNALSGTWYLSADARSAALDAALEAGLDVAYARPLDFITPHVAVPGNAAAMREVAADGVLAELASMDFLHNEFQRPLEELTHEFRAQHVTDIRAFRETIAPEPYPGTPAWDVYVGTWLGCHTEISVERATGKVVQRLVEID